MDARPIFDKFFIPALKTKKIFPSNDILIDFENALKIPKK